MRASFRIGFITLSLSMSLHLGTARARESKPKLVSCADAIKQGDAATKRVFTTKDGKVTGLTDVVKAGGQDNKALIALIEAQQQLQRGQICRAAKEVHAKGLSMAAPELSAALGEGLSSTRGTPASTFYELFKERLATVKSVQAPADQAARVAADAELKSNRSSIKLVAGTIAPKELESLLASPKTRGSAREAIELLRKHGYVIEGTEPALVQATRQAVRGLLPELGEDVSLEAMKAAVKASASEAVAQGCELTTALWTIQGIAGKDLKPTTSVGRAARQFFVLGKAQNPVEVVKELAPAATLRLANLNLSLYSRHQDALRLYKGLAASKVSEDAFSTLELQTKMVDLYRSFAELLSPASMELVLKAPAEERQKILEQVEQASGRLDVAAYYFDGKPLGPVVRFAKDAQASAAKEVLALSAMLIKH